MSQTYRPAPLPAWMDPSNPEYNPNWSCDPYPLAAPLLVQFGNGTVNSTFNKIHIKRWFDENAGVIVEPVG